MYASDSHQTLPDALQGQRPPFEGQAFQEAVQNCSSAEELKTLLKREVQQGEDRYAGKRWIARFGQSFTPELLRKLSDYRTELLLNPAIGADQARFLIVHYSRTAKRESHGKALNVALGVAALEEKLMPNAVMVDRLYQAGLDVQDAQDQKGYSHQGTRLLESADLLQTALDQGWTQEKVQEEYLTYRRSKMVALEDTDAARGRVGQDPTSSKLMAHHQVGPTRIGKIWKALPSLKGMVELRKRIQEKGEHELMEHPEVRQVFWDGRHAGPHHVRPLLEHPHPEDFQKVWSWMEQHPDGGQHLYWLKKGNVSIQGLSYLNQDELEKLLGNPDDAIRQKALRASGQTRPAADSKSRGR